MRFPAREAVLSSTHMEAVFIPQISSDLGIDPLLLTAIFAVVTVWSLIWKGVGLWFSARNHQKRWFVAMLILNTIGILEIIYLLRFRADKRPGVTPSLFERAETSESEVSL